MTPWPVVLALCAGCSFALTGPEANRPRAKAPTCSMGKGAVLTDGIFASIASVSALGFSSQNSAGALVPLAIAGLFVGSAIHGNNLVNDCRKANDEYLLALRDTKRAPPQDDTDDEVAARATSAAPPAAVAPAATTAPVTAVATAPEPQPAASPQPAAPPPPPVTAEAWGEFWKEVH